jgi:hypothetical protein
VRRWLSRRRVRQEKEKLLEQLWSQHENLRIHVDWARERGEIDSGRALMAQLRVLGDDIRYLQAELDEDDKGMEETPAAVSETHATPAPFGLDVQLQQLQQRRAAAQYRQAREERLASVAEGKSRRH